jgi:hypothetical protein
MSLKTKILIYAPYSSFRGTFQPCWGTGLCLRGGVHNIARNSDVTSNEPTRTPQLGGFVFNNGGRKQMRPASPWLKEKATLSPRSRIAPDLLLGGRLESTIGAFG